MSAFLPTDGLIICKGNHNDESIDFHIQCLLHFDFNTLPTFTNFLCYARVEKGNSRDNIRHQIYLLKKRIDYSNKF